MYSNVASKKQPSPSPGRADLAACARAAALQVLDGALVVEDERRLAVRAGAAVQKLRDVLAAEGWFTPTPT